MAATLSPPRLLPSGDSAITVEFSRNIDDAANQRVLALDRAMARRAGRRRHRDGADLSIAAGALRSRRRSISTRLASKFWRWRNGRFRRRRKRRRWRIPVVYGGEHGIDLEDVAKTLNTTPDEIVARHVAGDYRVAMIGFTPGWSYLSGLDGIAAHAAAAKSAAADAGRHGLDRRGADRRAVPRRPERLASAGTDRRSAPTSCIAIPTFLLEPGDHVTFAAVDAKTFAEQDRAAEAGEFIAELIAVMSKLVIAAIGPASSVQDGGRHGAQRYGLVPSGAMDRLALAAANALVGNEPFAAAVEIGPFGAAFTARGGAVRIALAGASRNADIAGRPVAFDTSATLADGETLTLGFARGGSFSYLAIEGGIAGEPTFGSLAVNARAGLGSPYPRPLQAGDELQAAAASGAAERRIELPAHDRGADPRGAGPAGRRIRRRAQNNCFSTSEWKISATSDRMGYRLEGPVHQASARPQHRLRRHRQRQHPGARQRRADRADAGPRHQRRLSQDRDRDFGRLRAVRADPAGRAFRFKAVSMAEAQAEARKFAELLRTLPDRLRPIENFDLNIDALHDANVAGDAVSAVDAADMVAMNTSEQTT